jgi:two-component system sensor histidine kinase YesM
MKDSQNPMVYRHPEVKYMNGLSSMFQRIRKIKRLRPSPVHPGHLAGIIRNGYMNLNLKYKLIILFLLVIIFMSVTLGGYIYISSSINTERIINTANFQIIEQIRNNIDFIQSDINDMSTFTLLNPDIQALIKLNGPFTKEFSQSEYNIFTNATKYLYNLFAAKDYIDFIIIYGERGMPYYLSCDRSGGILNYEPIKNMEIYEKAIALKGKSFWFVMSESENSLIIDNKSPKIAMCRSLIETNNLNMAGLMITFTNVSNIEKIYAQSISLNGGSVLILDEHNNVVSYKNKLPFDFSDVSDRLLADITEKTGSKKLNLAGLDVFAAYTTTNEAKWKIIYLTSLAETKSKTASILVVSILIVTGCLIISVMIAFFAASNFTKPIAILLSSMQRFQEGKFNEWVDFRYNDEIGNLGKGYNTMVDNIQSLVNTVYKLRLNEKDAKLRALQSQINPHFLYNTLDSIYWKAQKTHNKEICDMLYALSQLFRLTLNAGNDLTTVDREVHMIECYLLLQKSRYDKKFNYCIDVDSGLYQNKIPKLVLQPFVENSVVHGIKPNNMNGNLAISGVLAGDMMLFKIADDGCGFPPETLEKINKVIHSAAGPLAGDEGGYAIKNIAERLNLVYANNYCLEIISSGSMGTVVTLTIPAAVNLPHSAGAKNSPEKTEGKQGNDV